MEELDLTAGVSSVEVDVEGGHLLPSAGSASRRNFTASLSCMCGRREGRIPAAVVGQVL